MLFALTSPNPGVSHEDFNKWYDERHAPSRAACPGVRSVSRFQQVKGGDQPAKNSPWPWLAMYELESEAALKTEEYQTARKQDGDDESKMFDLLSRRVYTLMSDHKSEQYDEYVASKKTRHLRVLGVNMTASEEEHKDEPSYKSSKHDFGPDPHALRSSCWMLKDAHDPRTWEEQKSTPKFVILHETEGASGGDDDNSGLSLEWDGGSGALHYEVEERMYFKLWKQF